MTRLTASLLIILALTITSLSVHAQTDAPQQPYLYYYSQLLGGLIIEHPDGTDSRQIAADVIPPNMSGLSGPGWSPSGKYFAADGFNYGTYRASSQGSYLIDTQGSKVVDWLTDVKSPSMQWAPSENWLLVVNGLPTNGSAIYPVSFRLVNPDEKRVVASYSGDFRNLSYEWSNVIWEVEQRQLRFYIASEILLDTQYFQITIRFDGTVLNQSATKAEFEAQFIDPIQSNVDDDLYRAYGISPSGRYEASGNYPTVLHDLKTNLSVELPTHSQRTICRSYRWSSDEHYILTLDGILRAGGGCGSMVLGITSQNGELWRELGGCSLSSTCAGWLPPAVDISSLPEGQPKPIQLDPVAYESSKIAMIWDDTKTVRLRCEADLFDIIGGEKSDEVLFQLQPDEPCPYRQKDATVNVGRPMLFAYDPHSKLLATYFGSEQPVSIWSMQSGIGVRILKLNTYGYELHFTEDGKYLRARNVNGWKIYSVADILTAAQKLPQ